MEFKLVKNLKYIVPFLLPISIVLFILFLVITLNNAISSNPYSIGINYIVFPLETDVYYTITSPFGYRQDPFGSGETKFHSGIDISSQDGTKIVSCYDGEVIKVGYSETGLGHYVYLKHSILGFSFYSAYGHMLEDSIIVVEGQKVKAKEELGIMGSSGASTGTHLHFSLMFKELKFDSDHLIDPMIIFNNKEE